MPTTNPFAYNTGSTISGTYEFEVAGAQAAAVTYPSPGSTGGRGAILQGRYDLVPVMDMLQLH